MEHESNENFSELIEEYQDEIETPGELHLVQFTRCFNFILVLFN